MKESFFRQPMMQSVVLAEYQEFLPDYCVSLALVVQLTIISCASKRLQEPRHNKNVSVCLAASVRLTLQL